VPTPQNPMIGLLTPPSMHGPHGDALFSEDHKPGEKQ
jgi:hypothetical protein